MNMKINNRSRFINLQKVPDEINAKINTESKRIMENKTTLNRLFVNSKSSCSITIVNSKSSCSITVKDHKLNFLNNPKTYLLNSAKNELDRISKVILDKINLTLRNATKLNQ